MFWGVGEGGTFHTGARNVILEGNTAASIKIEKNKIKDFNLAASLSKFLLSN